MITKWVLIVWVGVFDQQVLSTQSFETLEECEAIALALEQEMDYNGWFKCIPYTFESSK